MVSSDLKIYESMKIRGNPILGDNRISVVGQLIADLPTPFQSFTPSRHRISTIGTSSDAQTLSLEVATKDRCCHVALLNSFFAQLNRPTWQTAHIKSSRMVVL